MKQFLIYISLAFFAVPMTAAAQTIDFNVKGIGIGTSFQTVLRRIGKPLSNRKGGINPCGGAKQILRYSGLKLVFDQGENQKNVVVLIEVTSSKWEVAAGVTVGASLDKVRAKFGQSGLLTKKRGFNVLTYLDGDGAVNFYFRHKKLVRVTRDLNLC